MSYLMPCLKVHELKFITSRIDRGTHLHNNRDLLAVGKSIAVECPQRLWIPDIHWCKAEVEAILKR
jgi:hypothetical protein